MKSGSVPWPGMGKPLGQHLFPQEAPWAREPVKDEL